MNACPKCKSRNIRESKSAGRPGLLRWLLGGGTFRCRDCHHRFEVTSSFSFSDLFDSACPRCTRTDLGRWSPKVDTASTWQMVLIGLGGKPYRCEYCRLNFVSWRRRREKFRFRRWQGMGNSSPDSR